MLTLLVRQYLTLQQVTYALYFSSASLRLRPEVLQIGAPELQRIARESARIGDRLQRSVRQYSQMQIVIVFRLTRIDEAKAFRVQPLVGPSIALILITFATAPIEVGVLGDEVGPRMRPACRTMMVYAAACLTAKKKLMPEAISASVLEIFAQKRSVLPVVFTITVSRRRGGPPAPDGSR